MINAEVTVKFIIKNTGDIEGVTFDTYNDYVLRLIEDEGLMGIVELDTYKIMKIKKVEEL